MKIKTTEAIDLPSHALPANRIIDLPPEVAALAIEKGATEVKEGSEEPETEEPAKETKAKATKATKKKRSKATKKAATNRETAAE